MAKTRSRFVCQVCGHDSPRWLGKCPSCDAWNSFVEEAVPTEVRGRVARRPGGNDHPRRVSLADVSLADEVRLKTGVAEFDRVMGGGVMQGSLNLLAGDPGIGKSTLMTELPRYLPEQKILYVTGEKSERQVKTREQRLGVTTESLLPLSETNEDQVMVAAREDEPDVLIIDSVQKLYL